MEALISNAWIHMSADKDIRLNLAEVLWGKQSMPEKTTLPPSPLSDLIFQPEFIWTYLARGWSSFPTLLNV